MKLDYIGNIDLANRKVYHDKNGGIRTENSIGIGLDDTTEAVIPTVIDGKQVSEKEAIDHFYKTGKHLGVFDTSKVSYGDIEKYSNAIHERQAKKYSNTEIVDRLDIAGDVKKDKNKIFKAIMTGEMNNSREHSSLGMYGITQPTRKYYEKDHSKDSYLEKVVDGVNIRFKGMLDDPIGTANDAALGVVNSVPDLISTVGDMFDVDTPASDSATKYLKSKLSDENSLGFDMTTITGGGGIVRGLGKGITKVGAAVDDAVVNIAKTSKNPVVSLIGNTVDETHNSTLAARASDVGENYIDQRARNWYAVLRNFESGGKKDTLRTKQLSGGRGNSNSEYTPEAHYDPVTKLRVFADESRKLDDGKLFKIDRGANKLVSAHEADHKEWFHDNKLFINFDNKSPLDPNSVLPRYVFNDRDYYGSLGELSGRAAEVNKAFELLNAGKLTKAEAKSINHTFKAEMLPFLKGARKAGYIKGTKLEWLLDEFSRRGMPTHNDDLFEANAGKIKEAMTEFKNLVHNLSADIVPNSAVIGGGAAYANEKNKKGY